MNPLAVMLVAMAVAASLPTPARASDIFLCVDAEGNKTFQNVGSGKGCKRMDVGPVLSVPASRVPQQRAQASNNDDRVTVSPANFPRVDRDTQRSRDNDRKRILEDELKAEEDKLARLKAEYRNGEPERRGDERNFALYAERVQRLRDDLARAEGNVNALRREIALLRTQ
ncbi:MAG: DUF4124 domain-containing protein [Betaproteobacteria bacterium]